MNIVIRLPTGANLYFVYLFLYFTLHVSGSHKPIIRGVSSCFLIHNHLVHAVFMLLICVCLWTGLSHADEQHKHHMNQMVVYKKQLETPLMMGL